MRGVPRSNLKPLTPEGEQILIENLSLVDWILQRKMGISLSDPYYEDYRSEGTIGLIKAVSDFDPTKGFEFSTYASSCIMGYVRRFRRDFVRSSVKLSRAILEILPRVNYLTSQGKSPEEISSELNVSLDKVVDALNSGNLISLNADLNDREFHVEDIVGAIDVSADEDLFDDSFHKAVLKVADKLSRRSYKCYGIWLDWIYSVYFGEKLGQVELGEKYDISQAQVSRILHRGKEILANELNLEGISV